MKNWKLFLGLTALSVLLSLVATLFVRIWENTLEDEIVDEGAFY